MNATLALLNAISRAVQRAAGTTENMNLFNVRVVGWFGCWRVCRTCESGEPLLLGNESDDCDNEEDDDDSKGGKDDGDDRDDSSDGEDKDLAELGDNENKGLEDGEIETTERIGGERHDGNRCKCNFPVIFRMIVEMRK